MKSYLFAALCLLAATSCKHNFDQSGAVTDIPPRLSRMYVIDSTLRAPNDTVASYHISYDGLGRVSNLAIFAFGSQRDTQMITDLRLEYAGADTTASRSFSKTQTFLFSPETRYDTVYYGFRNGALLSDSTRSLFESTGDILLRVRRRSFSGVQMTETSTTISGQPGFTDTVYAARRSWLNRVGPYLLGQLDSTVKQGTNIAGLLYTRYEVTMNPTVVPNTVYSVFKGFQDNYQEDPSSDFTSFWTPQFIMERMSTNFSSWMPGSAPAAGPYSDVRYQATTRADGYPVHLREQNTNAMGTRITHTYFVYE
jgi:hypothetical protein